MSVQEVRGPLRRWEAEGRRAGVATLISVRRSAPRRPGARFAVSEGGDVAGSVSSGCIEGDLHEHLRLVLEDAGPRLLHYGITDEMAADVGLACGGEIDVVAAEWDPADDAWRALEEAVDREAAAVLVTGVGEAVRGRHLLVPLEGEPRGSLGDPDLDRRAAEAARPLLDAGGTDVVELFAPPAPGGGPGGDARAGAESGAATAVFLEGFLPPPRLAIVGATPVAAALCRFAASLGWSVTVIDPRKAFADPARFPDAARVLVEWPDEGLRSLEPDRYLDVVVLAHDRKLDVPALATALRAGCRYVGQIGGRRTQGMRRDALREQGLDEEALARIRGPVGLDIGAETPEEIALSIAAELVAARRGR